MSAITSSRTSRVLIDSALDDPGEFLKKNPDIVPSRRHLVPTNINPEQVLRVVNIDGYKLVLWDTYRSDSHYKLGYKFVDKNGQTLFQGEDYGLPRGIAIDSDESVSGLLNFLTLKPGDTDAEYFKDYTARQMEFAENEAEELRIYCDDENPVKFRDMPGYEHDQ